MAMEKGRALNQKLSFQKDQLLTEEDLLPMF
jgi:hypothetical protein